MAKHRKTVKQFIKFGTVGLFGFALDNALVYGGIYLLGLSRLEAGFAAYPFTVTLTWFGNRIYTFRGQKHDPLAKQWARFSLVCLMGIVFNRGTYSLLVTHVPLVYHYPVLGLLAGTAVGMFFNFFISKKLVFR